MNIQEDKPKVRVVKGGNKRLKSGVIRSEGEGGTVYRGTCDRCDVIVTTRKPPRHNEEMLCKPCVYVARVGKPSTKLKRKGDRVLFYLTDCDLCGDRGKTPFLPKKGRPYLCDLCYKEEESKRRAEERARTEESTRIKNEEAAVEASDETREATTDLPLEQPPEAAQAQASPEIEAETTSETAVEPEIAEAPKEAPVAQEKPRFKLTCRRCKTQLSLKFKPERGERFICPDCFEKERAQDEKKKGRPSTRLLFNIECAVCGKEETVDFVPKSLSETICTDCFDKRRRK